MSWLLFCSRSLAVCPKVGVLGCHLALQANGALHLFVDYLHVVRHVGRLGEYAADEAADFGRQRVEFQVIDARRNFSGVCNHWYPTVLDLHRFFVAISRVAVNAVNGGSAAPHPLVWSAGTLPERRKFLQAAGGRAVLPGTEGIWAGEWVCVPSSVVSAEDIEVWPYSVGLLVKCFFLGTLHWPVGGADLGCGGVSFLELLILYERWAGERRALEKAVPRYRRPGCPISVLVVPIAPGIDIWRSCRFIGALCRSLCGLPGGLGKFLPCSVAANLCRLRHVGWENCGHGLTSRPRETASEPFFERVVGSLSVASSVWPCSARWYFASAILQCQVSFCVLHLEVPSSWVRCCFGY